MPPTEWAIHHGYDSAEHHVWQYRRRQTEQEYTAMRIELGRLAAMGGECAAEASDRVCETEDSQGQGKSFLHMTYEHLLIAQKPAH